MALELNPIVAGLAHQKLANPNPRVLPHTHVRFDEREPKEKRWP
jgi:hypothetical protein